MSRRSGSGTTLPSNPGNTLMSWAAQSGALAMLRLVGSGNPPLHRFRVGVEFAVSGRRDLDGMIVQHAALARALAEQLGLSAGVQDAVGAATSSGTGRGGPGSSRARTFRSH